MNERKKKARSLGASSTNNCRKATSSPPTYWAMSLSSVVVAACDMPAGMSHLDQRSLESFSSASSDSTPVLSAPHPRQF